ncbi:class I SAM-dependent methyltransferase [Acidobacteria bacterium AH-259-L09]|nr:class I SAM-dependent methyltransferase [Acidobacteria bacterium AH-259-L09]
MVGKNDFSFEPAFFEHFARYRFGRVHGHMRFVLDAACGSGYGAFFVAQKADFVVGIDRSREVISFCKENYRKPNLYFQVMDVEATAFKANSFDTVLSFETIEHLEDPEKFLWETRRILKWRGVLLISTPVKGVYDQTFLGENPYHLHESDVDEFTRLLSTQFHIKNLYGQQFRPYMRASEERLRFQERYKTTLRFRLKRFLRNHVFNHRATYSVFWHLSQKVRDNKVVPYSPDRTFKLITAICINCKDPQP